MSLSDFDADKFFLGILCNHKDAWNDGHQSLRYIKNRTCVQCAKEYSLKIQEKNRTKCKEWYEQNKERHHQYTKNYVKANPGIRGAITARYRESHRDAIREQGREYSRLNREQINERARLKYHQSDAVKQRLKVYYQTEKGRLTQTRSRQKYRALKRNTHHWHYTREQVKALFDKFNNQCAYCGIECKLSVDHWIPLSKGGTDVLSNLIPSCHNCNSSKCDNVGKSWYEKQSFYSKGRWNKIQKHLGVQVANGQIPFF